ncbi:MAG: membrane protein insertase YidC [bacterium]|nr:membrane protein insertase YidC [bacterium]
MDKRPIIGIVLIFLVLIGWQSLIIKKSAKQVANPTKQTDTVTTTKPVGLLSTNSPSTTVIAASTDTLEDTIVVKLDTVNTPLLKVVIDPVGASIVSLNLSKYESNHKKGTELVPSGNSGIKDIIETKKNEKIDFGNAIFRLVENTPYRLVYETTLPSGEIGQKIYSFSDSLYIIGLEYKFPDTYRHTIRWDAGIASTEKKVDLELRYFGGAANAGKEVISKTLTQLDTVPFTEQGTIDWVGLKNKYFLVALIPLGETESYSMRRFAKGAVGGGCMMGGGCATAPKDPESKRVAVSLTTKTSTGDYSYKLYAGPLDYELMTKVHSTLGESCYFGFKLIRPISRFFLKFFLFLHKGISNYGIIIIIFSLLMTIIFFPLTAMSQKSALAMQRMQPKLKSLQTKYKEDPKRMNQEVMDLYRKEGVSPVSGCLPLLIQMPIFFALYAILDTSIVLRNAVFIPHWIENLSEPDPFFILPIAMGIMMFIQQKMQSSQISDPMQRRMMYFMPIMFTVIFLNFPSGLVIYWFIYNTFSVIQTNIIKKKLALDVK